MGRLTMHWRALKAAVNEALFSVGFALGWAGGVLYINLVLWWTLHP